MFDDQNAIRGGNQVADFGGTVVRRDLAAFVTWQILSVFGGDHLCLCC